MDARALGFELGQTPYDPVLTIRFGWAGHFCETGDNFVTQTLGIERRMLWIWKPMQWQQPAFQGTWILFAISSFRTTQMQVHLWIGRKTSTRENSILKRKS